MTDLDRRCLRAARCRARERHPHNERQWLGAPADRPLCDPCEQAVAQALDDAPAVYVKLRNTLLPHAAVRSEMVTASRGTPLPLNARTLDLGERLWWLLACWEDEVRRIAGLTVQQRAGKREGRQVQEAAGLLGAHLSAWIAAPTTAFYANTGRDPAVDAIVEQSGVEAAMALLEWRQQVRSVPGMDVKASKAVRRYEHRCPACGVRAVTHRAGDDLMQCQSCHATAPYLPTLPREADYLTEGAA